MFEVILVTNDGHADDFGLAYISSTTSTNCAWYDNKDFSGNEWQVPLLASIAKDLGSIKNKDLLVLCSSPTVAGKLKNFNFGSKRQRIIPILNLKALQRLARRPDKSDIDQAVEQYIEDFTEDDLGKLSGDSLGGVKRNFRLSEIESTALAVYNLRNQIESTLSQLSESIPNEPEKLEYYMSVRSLLTDVLSQLIAIESHLIRASRDAPNGSIAVKKAENALNKLSGSVESWLSKNGTEATDWLIRFPVMAGLIGLLNLAGAQPALSTAAVIASVGGKKLYDSIKGHPEETQPD